MSASDHFSYQNPQERFMNLHLQPDHQLLLGDGWGHTIKPDNLLVTVCVEKAEEDKLFQLSLVNLRKTGANTEHEMV